MAWRLFQSPSECRGNCSFSSVNLDVKRFAGTSFYQTPQSLKISRALWNYAMVKYSMISSLRCTQSSTAKLLYDSFMCLLQNKCCCHYIRRNLLLYCMYLKVRYIIFRTRCASILLYWCWFLANAFLYNASNLKLFFKVKYEPSSSPNFHQIQNCGVQKWFESEFKITWNRLKMTFKFWNWFRLRFWTFINSESDKNFDKIRI